MPSCRVSLVLALAMFVACQPNDATLDEVSAPDSAADAETLRQLATE